MLRAGRFVVGVIRVILAFGASHCVTTPDEVLVRLDSAVGFGDLLSQRVDLCRELLDFIFQVDYQESVLIHFLSDLVLLFRDVQNLVLNFFAL